MRCAREGWCAYASVWWGGGGGGEVRNRQASPRTAFTGTRRKTWGFGSRCRHLHVVVHLVLHRLQLLRLLRVHLREGVIALSRPAPPLQGERAAAASAAASAKSAIGEATHSAPRPIYAGRNGSRPRGAPAAPGPAAAATGASSSTLTARCPTAHPAPCAAPYRQTSRLRCEDENMLSAQGAERSQDAVRANTS